MITVLVKEPGKIARVERVKNLAAIHDIVSPNDYPEFEVFDEKYRIGIYSNDSGRILGKGKNIVWNQTILYGTVVFVGIDESGAATNISPLKRNIVIDYLNQKSIR